MNDKPLGVLRLGIFGGGVFEVPYTNDEAYKAMLVNVRASGCFEGGNLYIPHHAIMFIQKVPAGILQANIEGAGETRQ